MAEERSEKITRDQAIRYLIAFYEKFSQKPLKTAKESIRK
jgi:hypothetical protein